MVSVEMVAIRAVVHLVYRPIALIARRVSLIHVRIPDYRRLLNESIIAACLTTSGASRRELSYSVCEDYEPRRS